MQQLTREILLSKALTYAEAGIAVFATTADGKAPSISNAAWSKFLGREIVKGQGGLHQASTDPDNLRWQFSQRGSGGIGMPCGKVNGVIVADFDIHKEEDREGNAHQKMREWYDEICEAHCVKTRSGGLHVYFAYEPGHGKFELGPNIEVQTDGAYVLLPPSKGYRVSNLVHREDWTTPPWLGVPNRVAQVKVPDHAAETPPEVMADLKLIRDKTTWHDPMIRIVAHLWGSGWSDAEILRKMIPLGHPHFSVWEVIEDVCVAIEGARTKWHKERMKEEAEQRSVNAVEAIKRAVPKLTDQQLKSLHDKLGRMINDG